MARSEEHMSELQSPCNLVCRLLLEKKKRTQGRDAATAIGDVHARRYLVSSRGARWPVRRVRLLRRRCRRRARGVPFFFFFNDTATTEIYTLSLHDALPI